MEVVSLARLIEAGRDQAGNSVVDFHGGGGSERLGASVNPTSFKAMIMPAARVEMDRDQSQVQRSHPADGPVDNRGEYGCRDEY